MKGEDEVTLPRSDNLCSSSTGPFSSYIEPVEVAPGGFLRLQSQARGEMLFGEMRNCQLSRITTIFTRKFCIKNDPGFLGHYCGYWASSGQRRASVARWKDKVVENSLCKPTIIFPQLPSPGWVFENTQWRRVSQMQSLQKIKWSRTLFANQQLSFISTSFTPNFLGKGQSVRYAIKRFLEW